MITVFYVLSTLNLLYRVSLATKHCIISKKASIRDLPGYLDVPLSRHKWPVPCDVEITGYDCIYQYLCKSLELAKTHGLTNKIKSRLQNMLIITSSQFFILYRSEVVKSSRDNEKKELPESRDLILE